MFNICDFRFYPMFCLNDESIIAFPANCRLFIVFTSHVAAASAKAYGKSDGYAIDQTSGYLETSDGDRSKLFGPILDFGGGYRIWLMCFLWYDYCCLFTYKPRARAIVFRYLNRPIRPLILGMDIFYIIRI